MIRIIICLIVGYLFGCISSAYIIGRINNIDIRDYGSGNAGTTNAMRTLGRKWGSLTYVGDVLKLIVATIIMIFVFKDDMDIKAIVLISGFGVVLGHNYPFWLNFKGGKGIAVTSAVILMYDWKLALLCILVFGAIVMTTKYVSVGSLAITTLLLLDIIINARHSKDYIELVIFGILFTASAFYTHRANIIRLLNGTENKVGSKKKDVEGDK